MVPGFQIIKIPALNERGVFMTADSKIMCNQIIRFVTELCLCGNAKCSRVPLYHGRIDRGITMANVQYELDFELTETHWTSSVY